LPTTSFQTKDRLLRIFTDTGIGPFAVAFPTMPAIGNHKKGVGKRPESSNVDHRPLSMRSDFTV
jgi:hypothetical protein